MTLEEFIFNLIVELVGGAIQGILQSVGSDFFEQRKIKRRIEDAVAHVVEPLLPFLSQERIPEDKQRRLIETCVDELRPLTEQPEHLFQGSLDGQKIFNQMYNNRDFPEVVVEDGLESVYSVLCPRIATMLCKISAAVKGWETEAWSENYRRLDEITIDIRNLFNKIDELTAQSAREADMTLARVRRTLAQKIGFAMDLTGLRAGQPQSGKFDDFFVHPEITEGKAERLMVRNASAEIFQHSEFILNIRKRIDTPDKSIQVFTEADNRTIVIGTAGAGKSTWSKWLQREIVNGQRTRIGIRVELRRFSSEPLPSLQELIREAAGRHLAEELTADHIAQWLDARQAVFILDGFDEVPIAKRDEVYDWIVDLSTAARSSPLVLTSRSLTTDHLDRLGEDWLGWVILPFDEDRIIDYIRRWYAHTPLLLDSSQVIDAENLARDWQNDPTIEPLTGNPLMLSTLLMVHHLDGSLPSGRSQLYQRYIDGMLGLWDDRRRIVVPTELSFQQKRRILRDLALQMFLQEQDQLDEPIVLEWLGGLLEEMNISSSAEDILAILRERTGLIVGPGVYSFVHKSIAEYLVAEAILQGEQRDENGDRIDRLYLLQHRDDDRWNSVTFFWAGLAPVADVETFIDQCNQAGSYDLGYGILYDQYERISREERRRWLLAALSGEYELGPFVMGDRYWRYSRPVGMSHPGVPLFTLRSLAYDLHSALL